MVDEQNELSYDDMGVEGGRWGAHMPSMTAAERNDFHANESTITRDRRPNTRELSYDDMGVEGGRFGAHMPSMTAAERDDFHANERANTRDRRFMGKTQGFIDKHEISLAPDGQPIPHYYLQNRSASRHLSGTPRKVELAQDYGPTAQDVFCGERRAPPKINTLYEGPIIFTQKSNAGYGTVLQSSNFTTVHLIPRNTRQPVETYRDVKLLAMSRPRQPMAGNHARDVNHLHGRGIGVRR